MWAVADLFVVIAMTIMCEVIMAVVVPDLVSGMSNSSAKASAAPDLRA